MLNTEVHIPCVTLADLCQAIEDGRVKAILEGDGHYAISRAEFLRFVAERRSDTVESRDIA